MICLKLVRITKSYLAFFTIVLFALLSACGSKKNDSGDIQDKFGGGSALNRLDTMLSDNKPTHSTDTINKPIARDTIEKVLKTHDCENDYLSLEDIYALRKLNKNKKIDTLKSMCFSFVRVMVDSTTSLREYGRGRENKPKYSDKDYSESIFIYAERDAILIYTYNETEFLNILEKISATGRIIENKESNTGLRGITEYQIFILNGVRYIFYKNNEYFGHDSSYPMSYVIYIIGNSEYVTKEEFLIFNK